MRATALIYPPEPDKPVRTVELTDPKCLRFLQSEVDGFVEVVPHFNHVVHEGVRQPCVVFCNENGKLERLPYNGRATVLWEDALPPPHTLLNPVDFLVGTIVVLICDEEFREEL